MSKENGQQNIQLAKLETRMENLELKVDKFISNEFFHFKQDNENAHKWVMGLVIMGILIPIVLFIIK